jgi:hypothetical protein
MGAAKDMLADLNKKHDGPPPVLESFVQLPGDPKNPKQYRILKTAEELDPIKPGTQISIPPNTLLMFTGEIDIRNPETHEVVATIKAEKSGMVGEAIAFSTLLSGNIYARSEVRCAIINRELDSDLANPEEQLALDRLIAAEFTKKLRQAIAARHAHKAAREAALQN